MSPQYMEETVHHLKAVGYQVQTSQEMHDGAGQAYAKTVYRVAREAESFVLECVRYSDGEVRYFLEVEKYHSLMTYSLQLNSWKYRDDRIEFRFVGERGTGRAVTFILSFDSEPEPQPESES